MMFIGGHFKKCKVCFPGKKMYFTCLPVSDILLEMIFCEIILKGDFFIGLLSVNINILSRRQQYAVNGLNPQFLN